MHPLTIITGSSRGMGEAMARQRLRAGHRVVGIARQTSSTLATDLEAANLQQWMEDLAEPAAAAHRLRAWLQECNQRGEHFASVTLINNAGIIAPLAPLGQIALHETSRALRVGLEAAMLLTSAFLEATATWTVPRKVLNISSGLGRRAMAGSASYCAAKAGMDHFSRAVSLEEAQRPNGARIVSLAPGVIATDMQVQLRSADPALFPDRDNFVQLQTQGVLLSPEDAAQRVLAVLDKPSFGEQPVADVRDA